MLISWHKISTLKPRQLVVFRGHTFKALQSSIRTIGILLPLAFIVMCNGLLWCFPFFVKSLLEQEIVSSLLIDPIITFRSWKVVVVGTWIWLRRSTKFWWCLYKAMSRPHKDILACVFYNYLRTLSSSLVVCWVDLFKAFIELSVSRCGSLKCLPLWCEQFLMGHLIQCLRVGSVSPHMWVLGHLIGVWSVSPYM